MVSRRTPPAARSPHGSPAGAGIRGSGQARRWLSGGSHRADRVPGGWARDTQATARTDGEGDAIEARGESGSGDGRFTRPGDGRCQVHQGERRMDRGATLPDMIFRHRPALVKVTSSGASRSLTILTRQTMGSPMPVDQGSFRSSAISIVRPTRCSSPVVNWTLSPGIQGTGTLISRSRIRL